MGRKRKHPGRSVSLYEAKTQLSKLVDEAAEGVETVICKNGVPLAKLIPYPLPKGERRPAHAVKVLRLSPDFDAVDPDLIALFEGR